MRCHFLLCLLLTASVSHLSTLVTPAQDRIHPEAEYTRIRALAHEGYHRQARQDLLLLLDSFPSYGDAWILLARVYAWQGEYEPAAAILDSLIARETTNRDAAEARMDVALWTGNDSLTREVTNRMLTLFPDDDTVRYKAEYVLAAIPLPDTADIPAEEPADRPADTTPALPPDTVKTSKTDIRAGYYFDTFSEPYQRFWQVFQLGAGYLLKPGRIIGSVNVGNLHAGTTPEIRATEIQFEGEAYPRLSEKDYAWLSYAFSPGKYFPRHRLAAEVWHSFPHGWVASAGMNYYYFNRHIFIAGISGEKYTGNYWFSSKIYFYFKDQGITTSLYLTGRRYLNDTDYLQLTAGMGTAPDEPFDIETDLSRLSAYTARIAYFASVTRTISIRAGIGYSREEYAESVQRNRFDGSLNMIWSIGRRR